LTQRIVRDTTADCSGSPPWTWLACRWRRTPIALAGSAASVNVALPLLVPELLPEAPLPRLHVSLSAR
jgi:hypothetical protein